MIDFLKLYVILKYNLKIKDFEMINVLGILFLKSKFIVDIVYCVCCYKEYDFYYGRKRCMFYYLEKDVFKIFQNFLGVNFKCSLCLILFIL